MKFERGLGKKQIWIKPLGCVVCGVSSGRKGVTLYSVIRDKKKVYVCKRCKYENTPKKGIQI